jgi:urease accessory protein
VIPTHQDGVLELAFQRDARGRSALSERRQRFPLRMTVPLYLDPADPGMAFVYAQNPTGGVFAGDRLVMSVAAGQGARVHLTTQSATKLYRMDGGEAVQELRFELGPGAYVEHVPDPLIPQAGASFRQRTVVEVAPDAAFVATESIAPGRRAHGERFAYDLLDLRTEARRAGRVLCVDVLRLEPRRGDPQRAGVLGGREYLVTLLAVAPERDAGALARRLDEALGAEPDVFGAAGELPHGAGAMARVLASAPLDARRALLAAWRVARDELAGLPLPEVRK